MINTGEETEAQRGLMPGLVPRRLSRVPLDRRALWTPGTALCLKSQRYRAVGPMPLLEEARPLTPQEKGLHLCWGTRRGPRVSGD